MWCVQLCMYTFIKRLAVIYLKFVLFRCLFDERNVLTRPQNLMSSMLPILTTVSLTVATAHGQTSTFSRLESPVIAKTKSLMIKKTKMRILICYNYL